jgi:N-acetylglucosamine kinase-like BadF-type ATPase
VTSPIHVGVDGGATRCRAIALDGEGREVGRAEGAPALASVRAASAVAVTVAAVVGDALRAAGTEPPVTRLVVGLAGAGRPDVRVAVQAALEATGIAREVEVRSDTVVALDDAFDTGPGILVVAGTGSMALGRAADGREARAGGWGAALGDEGSGWWLGLHGLRAVARAVDGRGPATTLRGALLETLGLEDPDAMIRWVDSASKGEVAALAPVVLRAANGGDAAARRLADEAARELAAAADAARRALEPWPDPPSVAGVGGLIAPDGLLRDRLATALGSIALHFDPREVVPARGAARRAWHGA